MKRMINERLFTGLLITVLAIVFCAMAYVVARSNSIAVFGFPSQQRLVIIDAGHGGTDGGAVGYNNIIEKDINLIIAQKLRTMLEANGYTVVMTRKEDVMLNDPGASESIRERKRTDMHARMEIIENNPNAIFLSIHQNLFSITQSHGAQMFYSPNNSESQRLAGILQKRFTQLLQPDNTRIEKQADDNLYLLYHAKIPAVLIECGFLSNALEAQNLCDDTYQNKIAFVIFSALTDYFSTVEDNI